MTQFAPTLSDSYGTTPELAEIMSDGRLLHCMHPEHSPFLPPTSQNLCYMMAITDVMAAGH